MQLEDESVPLKVLKALLGPFIDGPAEKHINVSLIDPLVSLTVKKIAIEHVAIPALCIGS